MIVQYFLALTIVTKMETMAPKVIAPFRDKESCMLIAEEKNRNLTEDMKRKTAAFVCLKIEYPGEV